jgi:5-methylcytosine-specific restriction protein A
MARDPQYIKLINSMQWRRLRAEVLSAHPLCQDCELEGRVTAATEVHHVTPIESGVSFEQKRALAYRRGNLRALCHPCHKAAHEAMRHGPSSPEAKELSRQRRQATQAETQRYLDELTGGPIFLDTPGDA